MVGSGLAQSSVVLACYAPLRGLHIQIYHIYLFPLIIEVVLMGR